jgi:hypothetical protein
MLGGMADEDLGGPGYASAGGVGVQVKTIRDDEGRVAAALPPRHRPRRGRAGRRLQDHGGLSMANAYAGDLSAQITAGSLSDDIVRMVECQMVLRALRNPDGAKSGTVTIDDFTRSWTLDSANSSGTLYVSDDELRLLGATTKRSGSFTMGSYTPRYTNVDPIDGYVYDGYY